MLKRFVFIILAGVGVLAHAASGTVSEYILENGLKILVREDHRAPVVVSQIWYKVGSSYEPSGITGVSHVLEHMMFKGTETIGPGEFSRIIAANGGNDNAFTSRDYTAYFQQLAADKLEVSFRLESDRMRNVKLTADEFAKEVSVVQEERRLRTDDSPQGRVYELLNATAYLISPYRDPVIGWMSDLKAMTVDDARDWYAQWYAPNNATLVVVGDVDPQAVFELAKTYFGPLKPSELPKPRPIEEIPQIGEKRVVAKVPAEMPYVLLGYKVPVLTTADVPWEPYALDVLAGILDAGNSSRLSRNLVRGQEVAASAGAGYSPTSRLDDLFLLMGSPAPGRSIDEVERALREQVRSLREEIVSPDELARIVAQVLASDVYQRDSNFYQAMRMGGLETVGLSWRIIDEYVDRIKAVTPQQVRDVARKYLIDDRLTVATLEPLPLENSANRAAPALSGELLH